MQMVLPINLQDPQETEAQREVRAFKAQAKAAAKARRRALLLTPFTALVKWKRARKTAPFNSVSNCRPAYDPQI